ncbi:hypothetical protein JW826_01005 [Candidatus Woesearchaeota archaeon]|nr:hypothetical protein [Candidatus Woesearchaeota archaeon]
MSKRAREKAKQEKRKLFEERKKHKLKGYFKGPKIKELSQNHAPYITDPSLVDSVVYDGHETAYIYLTSGTVPEKASSTPQLFNHWDDLRRYAVLNVKPTQRDAQGREGPLEAIAKTLGVDKSQVKFSKEALEERTRRETMSYSGSFGRGFFGGGYGGFNW